MRGAAARNIFKAWLLVALIAAAFAGIGWLLADERGAFLFAFCSLLAATGAYAVGDRALLGMLRARPFALAEDPLLRSTVDRLAAQSGIEPPKLQLIDDTFPRAFSVGRGPRSATVVVSSGLLTGLPPAEVEAVLAHEVAHIRSRDALTQTYAVLFSTTLLELTRVGGFLSGALLATLSPVGAAFTHLLLSPKRELAADDAAAQLVDPHDLADALIRLDRAAELVEFHAPPTTEPLYTVSPFDHTDRVARMFQTHPPVSERVSRLRGGAAGQQRDVTRIKIAFAVALLAVIAYGVVSWVFSEKLIAQQFTALGPVDFAEFALPEPENVTIRGEGVDLASWYFDNPRDAGCAVVMLHGFSGSKAEVLAATPIFWRRGCDLLLYDARGHGDSDRALLSFGAHEREDLLRAIEWLTAKTDLPRSKIGLIGWSYGAATAIQAASEPGRRRRVRRRRLVLLESRRHRARPGGEAVRARGRRSSSPARCSSRRCAAASMPATRRRRPRSETCARRRCSCTRDRTRSRRSSTRSSSTPHSDRTHTRLVIPTGPRRTATRSPRTRSGYTAIVDGFLDEFAPGLRRAARAVERGRTETSSSRPGGRLGRPGGQASSAVPARRRRGRWGNHGFPHPMKPAASYSPGGLRPKYHRRERA